MQIPRYKRVFCWFDCLEMSIVSHRNQQILAKVPQLQFSFGEGSTDSLCLSPPNKKSCMNPCRKRGASGSSVRFTEYSMSSSVVPRSEGTCCYILHVHVHVRVC